MDYPAHKSAAPESPFNRDFWCKLVAAAMIGLVMLAMMPIAPMMKGQNDFAHWYIGGTLYGSENLHSQAVNQQMQKKLIGVVILDSYFIRPAFYGLLLKPLSWLPYLTAYVIFQIISVACLAFFIWQYGKQWPDIYVYAAMSVPLLSNIVIGQDVSLLLAFCTASMMLLRRRLDFAAGLVFALCAIKFHLFLFTPIAMLAQKRWKLFWGAVVGEISLLSIGFGFGGGMKVLKSWIAILSKPENHPRPELMPNLRGMVAAFAGPEGNSGLWIALSALVAVMVVILIFRAPSYEKAFAYCLVGGLLVNVHAYIPDPVLLLMVAGILLDGTESRELGYALRFLLFPIVYVFLLWRAPLSAAFGLLMLACLALAVLDSLWRNRGVAALAPLPVNAPSMEISA